ncbi:MAG: hypothetical protein CSA83_02550 [Actinomycetales bacterium]|nr:MAG: hypothetical protein CSA83_02550 [Actinomycetales bacterium]
MERVFTDRQIQNQLTLELLIKYGGPTGLNKTGKSKVLRYARNHSRRNPEKIIDKIFTALQEQTVVIPGTESTELIICRIAARIKELKNQEKQIQTQISALTTDIAEHEILLTMPGVGVKTAPQILVEVGDINRFESPAQFASYAGIAPVTRRSGSSIRAEFPSHHGNKRLKNALFTCALVAAMCDEPSKAYYKRKKAEGKTHNAAIMLLARKRCDTIYVMLRDHTHYQPPTAAKTTPLAA